MTATNAQVTPRTEEELRVRAKATRIFPIITLTHKLQLDHCEEITGRQKELTYKQEPRN